MKILIVTPNLEGGGAEKVAVNLANYYSSKGHIVSMIAFEATGPYVSHLTSSVKLYDLNTGRRYVLPRLVLSIKRINPDIIISALRDANIVTGLSSFFTKHKMIFLEASTMEDLESVNTFKKYAYIILMKAVYGRAIKIIANSDGTKADIIRHVTYDHKRLCVIGNPVLPEKYELLASNKIHEPWFNDISCKIILNVGRLYYQKNQKLLIEAFACVIEKVPYAKLVILGEGEEYTNLISHAKNIGIIDHVKIISFQDNPYPFYKLSSVFVLTSSSEGFGNVIVEAMACETPVISTDCPGGPREILAGGKYGTLVPLKDVNALATAIINELTHPTSKEQLALARQRAMEFSVPHVAEKYLEVMNSV